MRLADSSRAKLSRFRILDLLSESLFGFTCAELAKRSGQENWDTRSFRASLASRLRRLQFSALVKCELDKFSRPPRSSPHGIYRWRISARGVKRLKWAKKNGRL